MHDILTRHNLYKQLTDKQRAAIDRQLDLSTYEFKDELDDFIRHKRAEAMADIRDLLRSGAHPGVILEALEAGGCENEAGYGKFIIDKKSLLKEVLNENEFAFSMGIYIDAAEVPDMDYTEFDIPPVLGEEGGTTL